MPTQAGSSHARPSSETAIRNSSVLRRVSNLGSARSGLAEWRTQRLTALALIPLGLYFAVSVLHLATADHDTAARWLARPYNALIMLLLVGAMFAHALAGLRSIFADYMHGRFGLMAAFAMTRAAAVVLAAVGALAILRAVLGYRGAA